MDGRAQMTHVRVLKPHCGSAMALQRGCSGEAGGGFVLVLELLGERGLVKLGEGPPKPLPSYPNPGVRRSCGLQIQAQRCRGSSETKPGCSLPQELGVQGKGTGLAGRQGHSTVSWGGNSRHKDSEHSVL